MLILFLDHILLGEEDEILSMSDDISDHHEIDRECGQRGVKEPEEEMEMEEEEEETEENEDNSSVGLVSPSLMSSPFNLLSHFTNGHPHAGLNLQMSPNLHNPFSMGFGSTSSRQQAMQQQSLPNLLANMPKELELRPSSRLSTLGSSMGGLISVVARHHLKSGTLFGPYQGKPSKDPVASNIYNWKVSHTHFHHHFSLEIIENLARERCL